MKKKGYIGLWLLLSVALSIIAFVSFYEDLQFGSWKVKKAPIQETLLAEKNSGHSDSNSTDTIGLNIQNPDNKEENIIIETDSLPQSIFIFGDSMTFNLALRLAEYAKMNGHQIHSVNWDSSNTKIWAEHDTLRYFISKYHPSHIFVSLGSNELYFKNPESRAPYVKRILEVIDTIPFVWIGPPNWKEDSGINDMLEKMCGKGNFFRSAGMEFKRKSDHIHPTRQSSALWVDSIMRWLPKSSHPFVVELPHDSIGKSNPHVVFLKALNK